MPQSANPMGSELGFIIGPLKHSNPDKIANRLFRMFDCIGIKCSDIAMITLNLPEGYARVKLFNKAVEDYAVQAFKELHGVMNLFDLRLITDKPKRLRVERFSAMRPPAERSPVRRDAKMPRAQEEVYEVNKSPEYIPVDGISKPAVLKHSSGTKSSQVIPTGSSKTSDDTTQPQHTFDVLPLSDTTDSSHSLAEFEMLEEDEDLEDYSEGRFRIEKPSLKTRSMQTSLETSSASNSQNVSSSTRNATTTRTSAMVDRQSLNVGTRPVLEPPPNPAGTSSHTDQGGQDEYDPGAQRQFTCQNASSRSPEKRRTWPSYALQSNTHAALAALAETRSPRSSSMPGGQVETRRMSAVTRRVYDRKTSGATSPDASLGSTPSFAGADPTLRMVHATIGTEVEEPCFSDARTFYHRGHKLDVTGKNVHLDAGNTLADHRSQPPRSQGPPILLRTFRTLLGRIVCAFLNSGGGVLYFGVNPSDATVQGLPVTLRYEDALRLDIDRQITSITPFVPPSAYKVNFVKVMSEKGHLLPDLRVLEIEVVTPVRTDEPSFPMASEGRYYRFKDYPYIWVNGQAREVW